jgi:hypothetical protein
MEATRAAEIDRVYLLRLLDKYGGGPARPEVNNSRPPNLGPRLAITGTPSSPPDPHTRRSL